MSVLRQSFIGGATAFEAASGQAGHSPVFCRPYATLLPGRHVDPPRQNVAAILASLLVCSAACGRAVAAEESRAAVEEEPPPGLAPADTPGPELQLNADELRRAEQGEVTSNSHTARWRIYTDLGRDLFSQGRMEEAEKYFRAAVGEAKQGFGPSDPHVASSCNNLAELYRMTKDYAKAEPLYLEAVERLQKGMGPEHQSVGLALHNVAGFYLLQRNLDAARKYYEQALQVKGKAMGVQHPEYANTMFHLGEVLRLQGHLADAETLVRGSLQILEDSGGGHTDAAVRRSSRLAQMLVQAGRLDEAENLQRKLLHVVELLQGPASGNATAAMENLAVTLQAREKLGEAQELLSRCLELRQKALGAGHMQVGGTLSRLASVLVQQGDSLAAGSKAEEAEAKYEGAAVLLRQAARIAERHWQVALAGARAAPTPPPPPPPPEGPPAGQGWAAAAAPPPVLERRLLAYVTSLSQLALALSRAGELPSATKEARAATEKEATEALRRALQLFAEPEVAALAAAQHEEAQRERLACLQQLASILSRERRDSGPAVRRRLEGEVKELLEEAAALREELRLSP